MSDYKNLHGLGAADVAHLRADDAFDGVFEEDSGSRYRVCGDLEPGSGQFLKCGPNLVRNYDGTPGRWLAEVVAPKPPEQDDAAGDLDALRTERDKLKARVDELQRKNARQRAELARLNPERDRLAALTDTVETFVTEARRHLPQADAAPVAVDAYALAMRLAESKVVMYDGPSSALVAYLAAAIREHLPAATRPALPEGHVAVEPWYLAEYLSEHVKWREWDEEDAVTVIQGAILLYARRAAEAGEG